MQKYFVHNRSVHSLCRLCMQRDEMSPTCLSITKYLIDWHKLPANMSNDQLKKVILLLKTKDDGAMPMRKQDIIGVYDKWMHHAPHMFNVVEVGHAEEAEADEDGQMDEDIDDDVVHAMLDLINAAVI